MLKIPQNLIDEIYEYVLVGYPNEICGLLVGTIEAKTKLVSEVYAVSNLNTQRKQDRYELDPKAFQKIDQQAQKKGLQILGVFHSHPDHPSKPSETDRSQAWEEYSYVILSVEEKQVISCQSWILNEETNEFEEEKIVVK